MPLVSRVVSAYRSLFRRSRLDRDLDDELRGFLDGLVEKKVRQGLDPRAARRAALLEVGGIEQVKQAVRDNRVGHTLEVTAQDVRYAWRGLRRAPGFSAVALLTFALGIGANVAVFSVVDAMLLQPLPFRDAGRLVFVWCDMTSAGYPRAPLSGPELDDLRARTARFAGFGAIWSNTTALSGDGDPEQLRIGLVTADFFSVLGAEPLLGRTFRADDDLPDAPASVVLSWSVWHRRYGGDAAVIGRRILLNNQPTTVIGVMPADFRLFMPPDASVPDDLQAWLPFPRQVTHGARGQQFLRVVGRMRPGVAFSAAQEDVARVARDISREFTQYGPAGRAFTLVELHADDVRQVRAPLLAVFGGVGILLFIACVNVAALFVARAAARSQEIAVRIALGAGRGRLVRQCLAEGLLLTAVGALGSLVVARAGLRLLLALRPHDLDRMVRARIDLTVLLFAGGVALAWGVLCALAPVAEMWRTNLTAALAQKDRVTPGRGHGRVRAALIVLQVALSIVLLVGAGLLLRTLRNIQTIDAGFQSAGRLSFRLALPASRYRTPDARVAFARRFESALRAVPGVTAAGAISHLPYDDLPNWGGPYFVSKGQADSAAVIADYRTVTAGSFDALGVGLVDGRGFTEADDRAHDLVVIVDELLARRAWPGETAVGKAILVDPNSSGHATEQARVIGVVRHVRLRSLVDPLSEQVYFSQRQVVRNPIAYVVATHDPTPLAAAIRSLASSLDGQLPVYDVRPLDDYVDAARSTERFIAVLAIAFAGVAALLVAVGVYGVVAYSVTRRRHEFGVRLAIGAPANEIVGLVLREGALLVGSGALLGVAAAAGATQLLRTELFGVAPLDPVTYATAILVLAACGLTACWIPVRRAIGTDLLDVLRGD